MNPLVSIPRRAARLFATVRYTRPRQWVARGDKLIRLRARRHFPALCIRRLDRLAADCPAWRDGPWPVGVPLIDAHEAGRIARDLPRHRFTFLGRTLDLGSPIDWNPSRGPSGVTYLWTFNLHYFEYLEAARSPAPEAQSSISNLQSSIPRLLHDWIARHPYPSWPGWEPYPIAERLIHWQRFLAAFPHLRDDALRVSVYRQVRVLAGMVEHDLANNHVVVNLAGLLAGLSMLAPAAALRRLQARASRELRAALDDQLAHDGTLVERSAMYHDLVLTKLLAIAPLQRAGLIEVVDLENAIGRMLHAAKHYRFSDGSPAHFNDSAQGIVPGLDVLAGAAREVGIEPIGPDGRGKLGRRSKIRPDGVTHPSDESGSGLHWVRRDVYECVIDAAGPAPPRSPGHCHAAIGAFILHWRGRPLIVDPGCTTYDAGPVRAFERSTAAHNTVCVAGRDQSDLWARFRIGRRARVIRREVGWVNGHETFAVGHDGYMKALGVVHTRRFIFGDRFIVIADRIDGRAAVDVTCLLTFGPGISISNDGGRHIARDAAGDSCAALWVSEPWEARSGETHTAERFGVRRAVAGLALASRTTPPWTGVVVIGEAGLTVQFDSAGRGVVIEGERLGLEEDDHFPAKAGAAGAARNL